MPLLDKSAPLHCRSSIYRGASEARRSHNTMQQDFRAQALTSIVGATLAVALVEHESKQASSAKKVDCRMQQICNRSLLTQPLEGDYYQTFMS